MEKNLTTGSVFKTILYFALPYLFSYFLQTLYGMADLFIIGQFNGTESTTAVANGSQVMHMLTVMIVGLAMGSTVIIGRAVGARHKDEIAKTVGNSVTLFMGLSIVLTIVLLLLVRPIVLLIQTPVEAIEGSDRKSVVEGESVDLGGRRIIKKFPAMYNAFCYGAPPHAGIAPGVDRMVMLLSGEESIREVIAFPMNKSAQDVMMDAPSKVTEAQLKELHIAVTEEE